MKKTYLYGGIGIFIVGLIVIALLFSTQKEAAETQSLAEIQDISSTHMEKLISHEGLNPEKQNKLNQITDIYDKQEEKYNSEIANILKKYKADANGEDIEDFLRIVEKSETKEQLQENIKKVFSLSLLQNDLGNILFHKESLSSEKDLELSRLEFFQEENYDDIKEKMETLIMLSITQSLTEKSTLNDENIQEVKNYISSNIFGRSHILDLTSYEAQKNFLKEVVLESLSARTSLSSYNKQKITENIIQDITELEILLTPEQSEDVTSFIIPTFSLENIGKFLFLEAYAEDADLSPEERQILLLKTEIQIEKILAESIEIEIQYNRGDISQGEYQSQTGENLVELEELVILKNSLENDESVISLDDIQRFNLGSYVDDSVAIEDLEILSYIQEKSGHIIVYNLNGSAKLGEENMPLYAGYGIETLDGASATIVFSDESILRLDPLSQVTLSTPTPTNISVSVERGSIWTRVLKPLLSGDVFTIESDGISLGVRGTSLSLTKDSSGTQFQVVDSFTQDGNPSVTLTEIDSGLETQIAQEKEVIVDTAYNVTIQDKTKLSLLSENPKISDFLREDLRYLSLLSDDRKRGFHNTPFPNKNDSSAFIDKIHGELEESLPSSGEASYIITNSELSGELVQTGSIYHLIQKDSIITEIKNTPIGDVNGKVQAVRDLDMQTLEDTLGSKRDLENRFIYNIIDDIVFEDTLTPSELEDIFLDFPIDDKEDDVAHLREAKNLLSINGGDSIVTGDISLPHSFMSVNLFWESSSSYITQTGSVTFPTSSDIEVIMTAILNYKGFVDTKDFVLIVKPRELTEWEKLAEAKAILTEYLDESTAPTYARFTDEITLPDFASHDAIIPNISWSGSTLILADGTTDRPSFSESPTNEYVDTIVTAKIVHPSDAGIFFEQDYTLHIKRLPGTPEEMANIALEEARDAFASYFYTRQSVPNSTIDHPPLEAGVVLTWDNGSPYISSTGAVISRPTILDTDIDVKVTFSHTDTTNTEVLTGIPLTIIRGGLTLEEIANLALVDAKLLFETYLTSGTQNVEYMISAPVLTSGVEVEWQNGGPYVSSFGNVVQRPTYNEGDVLLDTIKLKFTHPDTANVEYITSGISLNMLRQDCTETLIGGTCYELVAKAEYNSPGDIDLKTPSDVVIPRPPSGNVNLNTCGGTDPYGNGSNPSGTGNCVWTTTSALASMYGYNASKITAFDPVKSWLTYYGQSGIVVENVGDPDYLPYDVSSLDLGSDWAIEMSVRGEDLRRASPRYYLFNSPGNFSINNYDEKIRVLYPSNTKEYNTLYLNDEYHKITFTKDKLYINGTEKISHSLNLGNDIKVGSEQNNAQQWNGIINYLRIYKKN